MIITPIMLPTSSISKMFDIIRDEDIVSSCSTEQLKEVLCVLQNENLTRLCDDEGHPLLRCNPGFFAPTVNKEDMERIIRLEEALIEELRDRGERHISPTLRYKY